MVVKGYGKVGPVVSLAFVILTLFLPMFQLDCGGMKFNWTGVDLITGSQGPLERMGNQMEQVMGPALGEMERAGGEAGEEASQLVGQAGEEAADAVGAAEPDLPKEWALLAVPVLALLGIFAVLAGQRLASAVLIVLLIGSFAYFTVRGFELERMFNAQIATDMAEAESSPIPEGLGSPMGDMDVSTRKAPPFYMGFGASGLALLLLFGGGRKRREE